MLPRRNPVYPRAVRALIQHVPGVQQLRRLGMRAFMESGIAGQTRVAALRLGLRAWSSAFMRWQVRDPELRRRIWPDYPIGCKRVLFSSYYLPALQRPNVELVTERIERITPRGVRTADGVEREVDCLIYGTGFKATEFVVPMQVTGRDGRRLEDDWEHGAEAHLGITVSGYPSMFLMYGPNTNLGFGSIVIMIEAQVRYVMDAMRMLRARPGTGLDVRPEVQRASDDEVQRRLRHSVWTSCRSWYRTDEGRVVNNWPGFMAEYEHLTRHVDPAEYEVIGPRGGGAPRSRPRSAAA
jgi:cation diffusion facilitator CzcD-associated flavoprotein CzcO